jgi:hypothetical protein
MPFHNLYTATYFTLHDLFYWVDLALDRDQWRALANMIMNLWVPLNAEEFLSSRITGGL